MFGKYLSVPQKNCAGVFFVTLRSINRNVSPSIQVRLDNTYSPGESGANNAEPTDVKSPL